MWRSILMLAVFSASSVAVFAENKGNNPELMTAQKAYRQAMLQYTSERDNVAALTGQVQDLQNRVNQLQNELQAAQQKLQQAQEKEQTAQQNLKTTGERLDAAWANSKK